MASVTCDTQAYFNILFPSISFFFLSYFFVLLQNLSPLLFAIAQNCMGGGKGECK